MSLRATRQHNVSFFSYFGDMFGPYVTASDMSVGCVEILDLLRNDGEQIIHPLRC